VDDVWQGGSCRRSLELGDRLLHHRGPPAEPGIWALVGDFAGLRAWEGRSACDDLDSVLMLCVDECTEPQAPISVARGGDSMTWFT
jgi:hypothetical protein